MTVAAPARPVSRQWDENRWLIILPITKPMSMNARTHWRVKAQQTKEIRDAVHLLARCIKVPHMTRAQVQLCYQPATTHRRDAINLAPTLKACEDGLVDAKVLDDDTPDYIDPVMPLIMAKSPGQTSGRLWLVVTRLS